MPRNIASNIPIMVGIKIHTTRVQVLSSKIPSFTGTLIIVKAWIPKTIQFRIRTNLFIYSSLLNILATALIAIVTRIVSTVKEVFIANFYFIKKEGYYYDNLNNYQMPIYKHIHFLRSSRIAFKKLILSTEVS